MHYKINNFINFKFTYYKFSTNIDNKNFIYFIYTIIKNHVNTK